MISIIIPIFNGEKYIKRCFDSIWEQTEKNFEIIAVDDGSKDSSLDILLEIAKDHSNLKVIHTENFGVCHARNTGIENAEGEYITFVDVDDTLNPLALEKLLELLEKHNADISAMSKIYLDENGNPKRPREDNENIEIWEGITPLQKHVEDHIAGHSVYAKLYKKEIIENVRFEEGRKINEDSFFAFQCFAKADKMVFSDVGIYEYYETSGSASRGGFSDKYLDILYFANKKSDIIKKEYPTLEKYITPIIIRANLSLLYNLCKTYDKKYKSVEKECIRTVKRLKKDFLPVFSLEKRLIKIISIHLFPVYKFYLYTRIYKK